MENLHVRFGERGAETTCREAGRRCAPTLLSGCSGRVHRDLDGCRKDRGRSDRTPWAGTQWRAAGGGFLVSRGMAAQPTGEESRGRPLREDDRGAAGLRSDMPHRGRGGRARVDQTGRVSEMAGRHRQHHFAADDNLVGSNGLQLWVRCARRRRLSPLPPISLPPRCLPEGFPRMPVGRRRPRRHGILLFRRHRGTASMHSAHLMPWQRPAAGFTWAGAVEQMTDAQPACQGGALPVFRVPRHPP